MREVMARQRVSIRQLAELTGLHRNTVAQLRSVDTLPGLSQGTLEALCKALGCTPFELIEYDPD